MKNGKKQPGGEGEGPMMIVFLAGSGLGWLFLEFWFSFSPPIGRRHFA